MKLNELFDNPGSRYKAKRVGRGIGSGKGKTSGSGTKGQKSRTGVAIKGFEGGQMPIYRRLPKRGFTNIFREEYEVVNLGTLQQLVSGKKINSKNVVSKQVLVDVGVISSVTKKVKVLSKGELTSALTIEADAFSASATQIIEKLGGKVVSFGSASQA
jgi:large subunit ribosomal protein L15